MIAAAIAALNDVFSPPFRAVLWKSLGLTLVLLIGVWFGLQALLSLFVALPYPWLETTIAIVARVAPASRTSTFSASRTESMYA